MIAACVVSANQAIYSHGKETLNLISQNTEYFLQENVDQLEFTAAVKESQRPILVTNHGNPIDTDLDKDEGENLFAIYGMNSGDDEIEVFLFSEEKKMDQGEIVEGISVCLLPETDYDDVKITQMVKGTGSYIKKFSKKVRSTKKMKWAYLTGSLQFNRIKTDADFNGKKCSTWDIQAIVEAETSKPCEIYNAKLKLNVKKSGQSLIDHGPDVGTTNDSNLNFTLTGQGPAVSYTFSNSTKLKFTNSSSLRKNYGYWKMVNSGAPKKVVRKITMRPALRVANASGKLSVDVTMKALHGKTGFADDVTTGKLTFSVPDR